ncbi:hypothetical protein [Streptomyces sp. NBC_01190]|uniref:hypothetical protein n=1 Tax=Streptomyces sp. NBC_01190 TaxID=2903767 RepID=UPI003863C598|nr:hypothetical protein OG519_17455 [Streptomyces sp. NBC_01190]
MRTPRLLLAAALAALPLLAWTPNASADPAPEAVFSCYTPAPDYWDVDLTPEHPTATLVFPEETVSADCYSLLDQNAAISMTEDITFTVPYVHYGHGTGAFSGTWHEVLGAPTAGYVTGVTFTLL